MDKLKKYSRKTRCYIKLYDEDIYDWSYVNRNLFNNFILYINDNINIYKYTT